MTAAVQRKDPEAPAAESQAPAASSLPLAHEYTRSEQVRGAKFTVPARCRKPGDPKVVIIRELTPDEVLTTGRIAQGDRIRMGMEQIKLSLYMVDGKVVDHSAFEGEIYWKRWSAKVRALMTEGYGIVNNSSDDEDADFLGSMELV